MYGCRRTVGLEIQIRDPVDEVEESECGGEEDACVRVYLCDADVQPPVPPRSRAAVLETAEETGAVLPVQTLVAILLVPLLHVCGVVHLNSCGRARADVYCGGLLFQDRRKGQRVSLQDGFHPDLAAEQRSAGPASPFIFTQQQNVTCTFNLEPFHLEKLQDDP